MEENQIVRGNRRRTRVYLGLGSNEGDRVGFIQQAMQLLKDIPELRVIECSSLYETQSLPAKQLSGKQSPWFVNAVAVIETSLSASNLLAICKSIENRLNAVPQSDNKSSISITKPRMIDLDILFYGDAIIDDGEMKLPHPKILERAYALVPLLEIAPDLLHPLNGKTITQLHEELPEPELIYLYGTRENNERLS